MTELRQDASEQGAYDRVMREAGMDPSHLGYHGHEVEYRGHIDDEDGEDGRDDDEYGHHHAMAGGGEDDDYGHGGHGAHGHEDGQLSRMDRNPDESRSEPN